MYYTQERRNRPPRRKEKTRECFTCGVRTTHVYDHGFDRFICVECELGNDEPDEPEPPDHVRRGL